MARPHPLLVPVLVGLTIGSTASLAAARDADSHHRRHAHSLQPAAADGPIAYRGLTVTRPPEIGTVPDDQDIYRDGPIRYNDIRDYSPAPYTTSGVQFPYGLDGIGGYGSDLDFGAGQDAGLYNRGAGDRP